MSIVEIGALAQLVGALAILLSLVFVVIELRKNFRQNNIANSLQQELGRSQIRYAQMEEGLAKLLAKAYRSYEDLKDFEKIQFDNYMLQRMAIYARMYRTADDATYKLGADFMRTSVKQSMADLFSNQGTCECYQALRVRDVMPNHELFIRIVGDDVLAQPTA
jgi:ribosomal protein S24E